MKEPVVLKSNKYGLSLHLDSTIPFQDLVRAICEKFAKAAEFFGESSMILETFGREISAEEGLVIIQAIELNSKIKVILLNENGDLKDVRMKGQVDRFYTDQIFENAKIIRGSIKNEDVEVSDSSVIVLGDVKSKATIKARGNIIVLGELSGNAYAGYPDNNGCYIVASQLNAASVQIGKVTGKVNVQEKWSLRVRKTSDEAVGITVWNGELLAEPISSGLLKKVRN